MAKFPAIFNLIYACSTNTATVNLSSNKEELSLKNNTVFSSAKFLIIYHFALFQIVVYLKN